ncbi:hypothetical protein [Candidatus Hodarchaeum mangrovi]
MLTETYLIKVLDTILKEQVEFLSFPELQITSKNLDLKKIVEKDQIRIDLAALNNFDGSIYFFEAETTLYSFHPISYRHFCDFCYLVCPAESFDLLDSESKQQQINWADEMGVGIITITSDRNVNIRLRAKRQELTPVIRKEVIRMMDQRTRINFSTIPLWERTFAKNSEGMGE